MLEEDPYHKSRLATELVVATDDIALSEVGTLMKKTVRDVGLRATLAAEAVFGSTHSGTVFFGRQQPHFWQTDEIAFARAVANLIALLISAQRNADTLAALELTDDGIYTEDASGRMQYCNRAARMLSRHLPDGDELPKPDVPLAGNHDRHEIRYEDRELEIHRARLPGGGLIVKVADLTERNHAIAEREKLEDRLRQAAKLEAIGQLAGGMAHDFNNILGAVSGFASFITQDTAIDSQNRDFAQRILSASKRGKDMVDQIMTFAETQSVARSVANLGRAIQASRDLLAHSMHPGAMLEVELPETPILVRGNEVQIGQLVANLVSQRTRCSGWQRRRHCQSRPALPPIKKSRSCLAFPGRQARYWLANQGETQDMHACRSATMVAAFRRKFLIVFLSLSSPPKGANAAPALASPSCMVSSGRMTAFVM